MPKLPPPIPDELLDGFVEKEISFLLKGTHTTLDRTVTTRALVLGPLAVWQAAHLKWWCITHQPSTCWAARGIYDRDDALKIARVLYARGEAGLVMMRESEIRRACPAWFHPWVRDCQITGKYLDPIPYISGIKR